MAWIGRVCDRLRAFNIEEHIEEVLQFVEEKMAVLGESLCVLCLDGVDDVNAGLLKSEDGNIQMNEEEGLICEMSSINSTYVLPDDEVESIKKDSDSDIEVLEDSDARVTADISVIGTESFDDIESSNKEESSVTGSSDINSVTYYSQSDTLTGSSHGDFVTGSFHSDLEGLVFDDTKGDQSCTLRHMNATVANDYSERIMETQMIVDVLKKTDDTKLSSRSDEWDII